MSVQELTEQLKDLQDELTGLLAAEQHTRDQIDEILEQINTELAAQKNDTKDSTQLHHFSERLRHFEAKHPELTDSINRVLVTLGNLGI